ncbi:MAG: hypothetical protein Ta2F_02020 [Termitinemataceae bacterium]|nr:MAG: hypothetical protein Ta2F_02020 [Termitinemataceae bacterium]
MFSKTIAYLLWLISGFGVLGFHRFYLGKPGTGILWMFSGGLFGIGSIYDLLTLGRQVDIANALSNHYYTNGGTRYAEGAVFNFINDPQTNGKVKDSVERKILMLARRNRGIVSASETALEANIPIEEAKKQLEDMAKKGHAQLRVRSSGVIVYTFPDFMDEDSPLEDF